MELQGRRKKTTNKVHRRIEGGHVEVWLDQRRMLEMWWDGGRGSAVVTSKGGSSLHLNDFCVISINSCALSSCVWFPDLLCAIFLIFFWGVISHIVFICLYFLFCFILVLGGQESRGVLRKICDMLEVIMKRMDVLSKLGNTTDTHRLDELSSALDRYSIALSCISICVYVYTCI